MSENYRVLFRTALYFRKMNSPESRGMQLSKLGSKVVPEASHNNWLRF